MALRLSSSTCWRQDKGAVARTQFEFSLAQPPQIAVITVRNAGIVITHNVVVVPVFDIAAVTSEAYARTIKRIRMTEPERMANLVRHASKIHHSVQINPRLHITQRVCG
jgi:hypothetical protein